MVVRQKRKQEQKVTLQRVEQLFTEAEKHLLEVELVDVIGNNCLLVDVIYEPRQRVEMMILIEGVDRWNWQQQQIELEKNETKSSQP